MSQTARRARLLDAAMGEPYFQPVPMPVDVTDEDAFPNMAEARRWYAALPADRRAQLEQDWNAK